MSVEQAMLIVVFGIAAAITVGFVAGQTTAHGSLSTRSEPEDTAARARVEPKEVAAAPRAVEERPAPSPVAAPAPIAAAPEPPQPMVEETRPAVPDDPPEIAAYKGAMRAGMTAARAGVVECVDRGLKEHPGLGVVLVQLTLTPVEGHGQVSNATVVDTSVSGATEDQCIQKVLAATSFPAPLSGAPLTFRYPFETAP